MKRFIFITLILFLIPVAAMAQDAPVPDEPSDSQETSDETGDSAGENPNMSNAESFEMALQLQKPDHNIRMSLFPANHTVQVKLVTSKGDLECQLYAGLHPLTVLNFIALSSGKPAWEDASGKKHTTPYYTDLAFGGRSKGAYVTSGVRPEGTNFVIPDERCKTHLPKAGAIGMVQPHPGMASAQFILFARDIPTMDGLYTVFGQCGPIETIDLLTREEGTLTRVEMKE